MSTFVQSDRMARLLFPTRVLHSATSDSLLIGRLKFLGISNCDPEQFDTYFSFKYGPIVVHDSELLSMH